MKKRIYWVLLLLSAVGVLCASALTLAVTSQRSMRQAEQYINDLAQSISQSYDYVDEASYEKILQGLPDIVRVTFITSDGTVLYDSNAEASKMENHLDRPEIQEAIHNGSGEDIRNSSTTDSSSYYYALRLSDGNVLRLAQQYSSIRSMMLTSVPGIVVVMVILFGMALLLSHWLTKWMMKPVERAVRALDQAGVNADSYAELKPFFSHIQAQDQEIHTQKEILEQEREILGIITNNMREGLLLVSKDKNVVSVNPSAIHMLAGRVADPSEFIGKNYLIVNRTQELHDCVTTALSGASLNDDFTMHGRVYHIYASPTLRLGEVDGAVVIVLDETQQRMAERSRQEFSANVSHELKTPLTSISGYAEMMENGMVASMDDIRKFSGSIHKEALRLIALIDDIIRLSRIEEEVKEPQSLEPVELDDLCEAVMESLEPVAKKAEVSLHLETCPAVLLGEDGMLSELVYNLCENAIKYNHPGGNVWLSLSQDEKEIAIKVKDDGIGIPEESRLRVFERFYRVDKSHSKQIGGTGLGLSIVKHVVEYHHGRVELDSGLGVGTEIRVFLPKVIE